MSFRQNRACKTQQLKRGGISRACTLQTQITDRWKKTVKSLVNNIQEYKEKKLSVLCVYESMWCAKSNSFGIIGMLPISKNFTW